MKIEVVLDLKGFNTHGAPHLGGEAQSIVETVAAKALADKVPTRISDDKDYMSSLLEDQDEYTLADNWGKLQSLAHKLNTAILEGSLQNLDAPYGQFAADVEMKSIHRPVHKIGLRFIPST